MRIDVLTLFPEVMQPYLSASILGRAQSAGIVEIHLHQLRNWSKDPHRKVDDRPFGGGPGMVLTCQPVLDAVAGIEAMDARKVVRVLFTPQGKRLSHGVVKELAANERLLLICGHYEGFDERIIELLAPLELSIGDFVLTGGELPALATIDAIVRLLPNALGNDGSAESDCFADGLLAPPQYTRPREVRGLSVPDALLSGDHGEIAAWRRARALDRTRQRRPDLFQYIDDQPGPSSVYRIERAVVNGPVVSISEFAVS